MKFWTCDKCGIEMSRKERISTMLQTPYGMERVDLCHRCTAKYLTYGYASMMPLPSFSRKEGEREREKRYITH